MSIIATIEDAIIARIKATLGNTVRTVDWAPPDWDEDFIKRAMLALPGVFVIFMGGTRQSITEQSIVMMTHWRVVAVSRQVQDAKSRARGTAQEIGCYDMIERLGPALDEFEVPDVGSLMLTEWSNDEALSLEKISLMIQSMDLEMLMELPRTLDPSSLVPFITFHDSFNVGQLAGAPVTEDNVELPQ